MAGKNLILDPWNIWKFDLNTIYPKGGKAISDAHPTFKWDASPNAAYYQFSLYASIQLDPIEWKAILENIRVDGNEFPLEDVTLPNCHYVWAVAAYNAEGVKIAQNANPSNFHIIDLPEDC